MNRSYASTSSRPLAIPTTWLLCLAALFCCSSCGAQDAKKVIFERISQYHHIQVYDEAGIRTLSFNGSWETQMSLTNPLAGHFEYTEYFQMPFVWNPAIKHVLMAGLGGGSTQRAFQHYFTNVMVDTVEIDPAVVEVAKTYFHVTETPGMRIHTNDARQFLRLNTNAYDVILMDAYSTTRYGSSLPVQLTTKEFFELANQRLTTNGVFAYNVIGQVYGMRQNLVAAMYHTMKQVFPQVYLFPALESRNIVFLATKSTNALTVAKFLQKGDALVSSGEVTLPTFATRMKQFTIRPPPSAATAVILTDDYAPVESLMDQSN
jgi:spermidine synthase